MKPQRLRAVQTWGVVWLAISSAVATAAVAEAEIRFNGLVRTRPVYAERLARECLRKQGDGEAGSSWSAAGLEQCVMNARLFSEVRATITGRSVLLDVKERWTLIPIPAISAGSGRTRRAGLFLLESNFLGFGMSLAAGATLSNAGSSYFGFLADPSLFFTPWHYSLMLSRQVEELVSIQGDGDESDGFREVASGLQGNLGYRWDHWSLSGGLARRSARYAAWRHYTAPEDRSTLRASSVLAYDARDYRLYFSEGFSLRLAAQADLRRSGEGSAARILDAQVSWQGLATGSQALQLLAVAGIVEGGDKADAPRIGGARGLRGMEALSVWAGRYRALAVDYQIPLRSFSAGTLTFAPFFDAGRVEHRGGEGRTTDYRAAGGGVYFFLKEIALPGIGLEAGYNDRYMKDFFKISAGLSL